MKITVTFFLFAKMWAAATSPITLTSTQDFRSVIYERLGDITLPLSNNLLSKLQTDR